MTTSWARLSLVFLALINAPALWAGLYTEGNLNDYLAGGYQIVSTVSVPSSYGVDLILVVQKDESALFCQVGLSNVTQSENSKPIYVSGPWNNALLCLPLVNDAYDGVVQKGQYQLHQTKQKDD